MTMKVFYLHVISVTLVMLYLGLLKQKTIRHNCKRQYRYDYHSNEHCDKYHLDHANIDFSYRNGNRSLAK